MKLSILEDIYLSYRFIVYSEILTIHSLYQPPSQPLLVNHSGTTPATPNVCSSTCLSHVSSSATTWKCWQFGSLKGARKSCRVPVGSATHQHIYYKNQFNCCLVEWWRTIYYIYYVYCINLNHNKEHHDMTKLPNVWGPVSGIWWSLPNLQVDTTASVSSFTELQALKICWGKKRRWVESPLKDLHIIKYTSRALCISASSAEPVHPKAATAWGMMWMRRCTRLAASANDGLSAVHNIEHIELQTWCCLHVSLNHRVEILVGTVKGSEKKRSLPTYNIQQTFPQGLAQGSVGRHILGPKWSYRRSSSQVDPSFMGFS